MLFLAQSLGWKHVYVNCGCLNKQSQGMALETS
jgi:hypothetical protein